MIWSILTIKNVLVDFENNFKLFYIREKKTRKNEDIVIEETSFGDFINDINYIISQIKYLIKSHKFFELISTIEERNNINSYLQTLSSYIQNSDYNSANQYIKNLKIILRAYWNFILLRKDYISDFYEELTKVKKEYSDIQWYILNLQNLIKSKENAIEDIEALEETYDGLALKLEEAEKKVNTITDLLNTSKSNEWIITNFAKSIQDKEKTLINIDNKTDEYKKSLLEYKQEHDQILEDGNILIEQAKNALRLKTAEWISAAIQQKFEDASKRSYYLWLVWALLFLLLTLVLWLFIAFPEYMFAFFGKLFNQLDNIQQLQNFLRNNSINNDRKLIIWRIAMIPLAWSAAWFCATQYIKQKNIIEDYGYKLVLAQSLVWFSEEFLKYKDNESQAYKSYVERVLNELLQDPLRSRSQKIGYKDSKNMLTDAVDLVTKVKSNFT